MTVTKNKFGYGNEVLFGAIMILLFAPHQYKLPGIVILCFCLIIAAVIDWERNTNRVRRITKKVAACGCVKARETISQMQVPQLLINCTVCGTKTT
jgi:hypothetical protein